MFDAFVKSRKSIINAIQAKACIKKYSVVTKELPPGAIPRHRSGIRHE